MSKHHHQNWAEPYNEAVALAKAQHQNAIAAAHDEFKKAAEEAKRIQHLDYLAARDAFDVVKSDEDHPALREAYDAFQRAKAPASLSKARRELADAIRKADQDYKLALVAAGEKHNVSVTVHDSGRG
jgi:hypothetical protein